MATGYLMAVGGYVGLVYITTKWQLRSRRR